MSSYHLKLPEMGESISEATIISWHKKLGDSVSEGDIILSVATDKVDNDIVSEVDGVVSELSCAEEEVVRVGQVLAVLELSSDTNDATLPVIPKPIEKTEEILFKEDAEEETIKTTPQVASFTEDIEPSPVVISTNENYLGKRFYSPLIKSMAKKKAVLLSDLDKYEGSGHNGRFTKEDFLKYLENRVKNKPIPATKISADLLEQKPPERKSSYSSQGKRIPLDRIRKLIAGHMKESLKTSAHVQTFLEADVTNLAKWRDDNKTEFEKKYNQKLTFTPLFVEAISKTLQDYPMLNNSLQDDHIIVNDHINIGMATALSDGNLIVPVIKNADKQNLIELATQVNDLAMRARANNLKPEEISNGTYTFTNIGGFGSLMGTPIINQPQLAILALGAIQKVPAVSADDKIVIRHKMYLSHSYDHRVIDGALGGMFVKRVADYLEQWDSDRKI